MGYRTRRRLVTLLDVGVIASGLPGGGPPIPLLGLGVWYQADNGPRSSVAAQFTAANTEYLEIASNPSVQLGNIPWTVGGWVWLDSYPTTAAVFLGKRDSGNGSSSNYQVYVLPTGVFNANISNGTTITTTTGGALSLGAWHFVMAFYDPAAATFSIQQDNGAAVVSAGAVIPEATSGVLRVGGTAEPTTGFPVNGRQQNWFIFGRLLDPAERLFLWNGGTGRRYEELTSAFKTNLRAWWPLDELSGSRRDVSGNNNTLTDVNTVTSALGWVRNTPTAGNGIIFWDDSGAGDWDLGLAAPTDAPTWIAGERNGLPVARFDGANDYMRTAPMLGSVLAGANAQTVFVVQRQTAADAASASTATYSWDSSGTAANEISAHLKLSNSNIYHIAGTATGGTGFTQAVAPEPWSDTWHIAELVRDGTTNSSLAIDGNPVTVTTFPTTGFNTAASSVLGVGDRIGRADAFGGDIAELIIYSRVLTIPERDQVRSYLKTKWGIAQNKLLLNPAKTGYLLLSPSRNDRLALN